MKLPKTFADFVKQYAFITDKKAVCPESFFEAVDSRFFVPFRYGILWNDENEPNTQNGVTFEIIRNAQMQMKFDLL